MVKLFSTISSSKVYSKAMILHVNQIFNNMGSHFGILSLPQNVILVWSQKNLKLPTQYYILEYVIKSHQESPKIIYVSLLSLSLWLNLHTKQRNILQFIKTMMVQIFNE